MRADPDGQGDVATAPAPQPPPAPAPPPPAPPPAPPPQPVPLAELAALLFDPHVTWAPELPPYVAPPPGPPPAPAPNGAAAVPPAAADLAGLLFDPAVTWPPELPPFVPAPPPDVDPFDDEDPALQPFDVADDPELGAAPTDADYDYWQLEAEVPDEERALLSAAAHPAPGTVIVGPLSGQHSHATNRGRGTDSWQWTNAVDVWLYPGTPILAVRAGAVAPGRWGIGEQQAGGHGAGWRLHLVCGGGLVVFYAHLRSVTVRKGDRVAAGQLLGYSGLAAGTPFLHLGATPPSDPARLAALAYNLRAAPRPTTPVGPHAPPVPGAGSNVSGQGEVEGAWLALMRALGPNRIRSAQTVNTFRGRLGKAVN